jgi:hypothetical protein
VERREPKAENQQGQLLLAGGNACFCLKVGKDFDDEDEEDGDCTEK